LPTPLQLAISWNSLTLDMEEGWERSPLNVVVISDWKKNLCFFRR
jgi:hypothetical protein